MSHPNPVRVIGIEPEPASFRLLVQRMGRKTSRSAIAVAEPTTGAKIKLVLDSIVLGTSVSSGEDVTGDRLYQVILT